VPGRDERDGALLDRAGIADRDSQAIVTRATAREPADRYPSAQALADDVLAVLEHRPVAARDGGAGYRVGRFVRRFPVASGLAAAFVAALIGGIVVSLTYARQAEAEAQRAQAELARAEFFLERNDVVNRAREAYADALQAMFASDADVERLTALLKARWQEGHANRASNPTQAASLSYSIGRHFLFRNDYVTALEILEPWVTEGYGPPGLLQQGRRTIAYAYQYTGRRAEAETLFRQLLAEIESGFEAFTPDHAGTASDLASLTRNPADLAHAETVLLAVASQPHDDPDIESYLWNQTGLVRQWQGNAQGSLEAFRRSVALIEANPLAAMAGRDTRRLNLANAELHHGKGPAAAEAVIARVLAQDLSQSGINREIGRARAVLGEIALVRGQLDVAAREFAVGADIIERFAGPLSGDHVSALAGLVEAEVRRGRLDAARAAQARLDAYDAETGARHPLGGISRALLAATTGDFAHADAELGWVTAQPERLKTISVAPRRVQVAQARLAEARRAVPAA
jgi:tetratricopeptide (TPR) repeat protein